MINDKTQQQSTEQQANAQAKSLSEKRAPAEIDGYSMVHHLGSGAFGEVWLAIDETTRRRVAIKFYNRRSVSDVRSLAKEVEKLVALSADRYVVQLLDVGWDSDPPFYVMDYIDRGSLEDLLKSERKLPIAEALEIFQETAIGLMHLHGKGVLHCDLKPGNVLLDEDNKPRLADFGQSRLSNEATPSLGTLFYMAPEQADLDAVPDAKWDVYALGALFFVMLTGRPPYYDNTLSGHLESTGDIRHRLESYRQGILAAPIPTKHRLVQGVDRQLAEIIDRCVAADPKKRFATVQSVLLALRQRHDAISRRPLLVLGLLGPLMLLLVLLVFGWNAYRQAVVDSDAAITSKAQESNRFAAKLAARSAAEQIDTYFREIEQFAQNELFRETIKRLLADEKLAELRLQLSDPNRNTDEALRFVRSDFITSPVREVLQKQLRDHHESKPLEHVASWWVYDLQGNQLAGVFENTEFVKEDQRVNTIGRNYSFRSYFSGLSEDLIDNTSGSARKFTVSEDPKQRRHITGPNLSSVFLSEQSRTWKIAFSTPVFEEENIVAIVGLTVQMGDFIDFESGNNQYAMMFDGREGPHHGVILEHPLFEELVANGKQPPSDSISLRVHPEEFENQTFFDPIGKIELGKKYATEKIAAVANIEFSDKNQKRRDSGLSIAVLEDFASIIKPSHELGRRLFRMAMWASIVLLFVAFVMWLVVARMFRDSRARISRAFSGMGDSELSLGSLAERSARLSGLAATHSKTSDPGTSKQP